LSEATGATGPAGEAEQPGQEMAALAKGGRTNLFGFFLRLIARIPFLFIGSRVYGAAALGRFALALIVVELAAMVCSLGERRYLAQRLTEADEPPAHVVADGMLLSFLFACAIAAFFYLVPAPLYPNGDYTAIDRLIVIAIPLYALTEIWLAALAYRLQIGPAVWSRAIVEPWTISLAAGAMVFVLPDSGLTAAYVLSIVAAAAAAFVPFARAYGLPRGWKPSPRRMGRNLMRALPITAADVVEWGTRRIDLYILGLFAPTTAVGIYYTAQQLASLPQKLKTSFEPVLGPVITRNIKTGNYAAIARQMSMVGFWIVAAQIGIALTIAIPGEGVMGLFGPSFVAGTGALSLLLVAEVVASPAVVSEGGLVYLARVRNMAVSVATIGLQVLLTVGGILLAQRLGLNALFQAAAAALALTLSLALASLVKTRMLSRILGHRITNWRWALAWAAAPAVIVGFLATTFLPEWAELLFGVPLILGVYLWVLWARAFGPEDKVLFRKTKTA
jgi:O-antigen/teichoic acid export membrane protein